MSTDPQLQPHEIYQKNQVIRSITQQLLDASVPPLAQAIKKLEENYNPYHRVYFPFSALFEQTDIPELGKEKLANCNSPHRRRIPELIMARGFKINLNQILDNGNYYMRPVDRLAKETGYEGAYIEDHGISFTLPDEVLTDKIKEQAADYEQLKQRFMLTQSEIDQLKQPFNLNPLHTLGSSHSGQKPGYAWRQRTSQASNGGGTGGGSHLPYLKKVYPELVIPVNYLHKLRRDLGQYYSEMGYGDSNKIGQKSCDLFYQKEQNQTILKIFKRLAG